MLKGLPWMSEEMSSMLVVNMDRPANFLMKILHSKQKQLLELIHSDVTDPIENPSITGM